MSASPRAYAARPLAAVGVVAVSDGRVLLVRRGQPPRQDIWTLPGGAIEWGETAFEAAAREAREECGLSVRVERVLDVVDLIERDEAGAVRYHYTIVECLVRPQGEHLMAGSDAAEARWVTPAELDGYALSADALRIVEMALCA